MGRGGGAAVLTRGNIMLDNETRKTTLEVTEWFFNDYLPTWVGVASGAIDKGPDFILDYWGAPLYDYHPDGGGWALDGDTVTGWLHTTHARLKANGFSHAAVMDQVVRAYHRNGAAVELIAPTRRRFRNRTPGGAFRGDTHRKGLAYGGDPTPANQRRHLARGLGLEGRSGSAMSPLRA